MSAPPVERVRSRGGLVPGRPAVVAFSGGRDSLCLLDLAVAIVGADEVLAVHVHHGLRGRDADDEALRAAATARRLGAAARVVRLAVPPAVRRATGSPASWARDARRRALRGAADAWGGPATPVLVAHTAGDQAETVLLRAISSPGTRALAGIAERDDARGVLRPLLAAGLTRAETGAWCRDRGLTWTDDPTNPVTPRGRVRRLLAELERIDGRAPAALVRTAALAREDEEALAAAAAQLLASAGAPPDGVAEAALRAAPVALGRRVLRTLAERATGASCPRAGARLEEVLALRPEGGAPAALDLGDGARAVLRDGVLRCVPTPRRA